MGFELGHVGFVMGQDVERVHSLVLSEVWDAFGMMGVSSFLSHFSK